LPPPPPRQAQRKPREQNPMASRVTSKTVAQRGSSATPPARSPPTARPSRVAQARRP
jgi:hypothetical protein